MAASITARKVVKIGRSHIGTREHGNNHTIYGRRYGLDGYAWCGIHVWDVFYEAGVDLRKEGITAAASTNAFDEQARRMGWKRIDKSKARPGDVVFYDFGDLGAGDTANDNDHVGIVSRRSLFGSLKAIEGNTSSGLGGSQANGDGVFERTRSLSLVRHVYRPPYAAFTLEMKTAEAKSKAAAEAKRRAALRKAEAARKKKAAAVAAAAAAALLAGGGASVAVGGNDNPGPSPTPSPSASASPSNAVTPTPTPAPTAPPKPTVKPKPKPAPPPLRPVLTRLLQYRPGHTIASGADVRRVQTLVGLRGKKVDGQYGPGTAAAVKKWQRKRHLTADGAFGRDSALAAAWKWSPRP